MGNEDAITNSLLSKLEEELNFQEKIDKFTEIKVVSKLISVTGTDYEKNYGADFIFIIGFKSDAYSTTKALQFQVKTCGCFGYDRRSKKYYLGKKRIENDNGFPRKITLGSYLDKHYKKLIDQCKDMLKFRFRENDNIYKKSFVRFNCNRRKKLWIFGNLCKKNIENNKNKV